MLEDYSSPFMPASTVYADRSEIVSDKIVLGFPIFGWWLGWILLPIFEAFARCFGGALGGLSQVYIFTPPIKFLPTQTLKNLYETLSIAFFGPILAFRNIPFFLGLVPGIAMGITMAMEGIPLAISLGIMADVFGFWVPQ